METEQIDKLFLELSQFTQATTKKELELEAKVEKAKKWIAKLTIYNDAQIEEELNN